MKEGLWVVGISGLRCKECIYHLLCAAFGQCVAVAQVVDLDILDIVTILRVDLVVEGAAGRCRLRG